MKYRYNPSCGCARCRAHGFMGPAVLITIGVLFLLARSTDIYFMKFDKTWPALLIVIGLIMFLQHNAPATGHMPREYMAYPPPRSGTTLAASGSAAAVATARGAATGLRSTAERWHNRSRGGAQWLALIQQPSAPLPPPPPVYRYRRSLAGPLILIVIGMAFLLRNAGVHLPVWHFYGRFWPVLIILWGLIALIEHFTALKRGYQTRGLGGGGIFLLILIVISGLAAHESADYDWSGRARPDPDATTTSAACSARRTRSTTRSSSRFRRMGACASCATAAPST